MAYFLFKGWHEQLFFLKRQDMKPVKAKTELTFLEINADNSSIARELRGEIYESQFRDQLSMGDYGLYACCDGKPVAYGWVKHSVLMTIFSILVRIHAISADSSLMSLCADRGFIQN